MMDAWTLEVDPLFEDVWRGLKLWEACRIGARIGVASLLRRFLEDNTMWMEAVYGVGKTLCRRICDII